MSDIRFSVVIPIYNEEDNIAELYRRLTATMSAIQGKETTESLYEIIFVDDGSDDGSWKTVLDFHTKDSRVKGISFLRNFGHHKAIAAGLEHATGDFVILMDGDLQDPPEEIPKLLDKIGEGYDIIYAIRETRKDTIIKKISSNLFYKVLRIIAKLDLDPKSGIFRIINRRVVQTLKDLEERSSLIIGLMSWTGFSQIGVPTIREARHAGKTKYNLIKSVILAMDVIATFSYSPMRMAAYMGAIITLISIGIGLYLPLAKILFGLSPSGIVSIIAAIFFIGGIQLIVMGILGEYIGRIFTEVQKRPIYLIKEKLGINGTTDE